MLTIRHGNTDYTQHLTSHYIILSNPTPLPKFSRISAIFLVDLGLIAFVFTILTATIGRVIYAGNAIIDGGGVFDHLSADTLAVAIFLGVLNESVPCIYRLGMSSVMRRHERSRRTVRAKIKSAACIASKIRRRYRDQLMF